MDCPRCHLLLSAAEYEGQPVQFCNTCWGYWLTRPQLEQIVHSQDYQFDEAEVEAVEQTLGSTGDADRQGSEREPVHCPECRAEMTRKKFERSCPVLIDECESHGIWLDTGEIKDLQVFIERSMK